MLPTNLLVLEAIADDLTWRFSSDVGEGASLASGVEEDLRGHVQVVFALCHCKHVKGSVSVYVLGIYIFVALRRF
jgi:hypothetical protein